MGDTEESAAAFWNTRAVVVTDEMVERAHRLYFQITGVEHYRAMRAALEAALGEGDG